MKKILLLFLMVITGFVMNAQVSAPYTETFNATTLPTSWSVYNTSGSNWVFTGSPNNVNCTRPADHTPATTGGSYAWLDQSGGDAGNVLEMPSVYVGGLTVPELNFWYYMCGVGYTPINSTFVEAWDGTAWVLVNHISTSTNGWEEKSFILTAFKYGALTDSVKVRFRSESGGSSSDYFGDNSLDDISVREAPTCIKPSNLSANVLDAFTAEITWTDNNTTAPSNGWEIELGAATFTPTGVPNRFANTNPDTLTGLIQNTAYDYYIRARCSASDSSFWEGPYSFTTPPTCPQPTNIITTAVTNSSVTLDWTENGTATLWGLEIGLTGFTPSGNPTFTTTTKPYTPPAALPTGFTFDVYITSICSVGDTSIQTGPFTFTVCSPLTGTYTIDSTMATGGTNVQSFAEAKQFLENCGIGAPVVFNVMNAVNNENVSFDEIAGASATNTITFNGNGNILQDSANSTSGYVLQLIRSDYYRFNDLTVKSNRTSNVTALQLTGQANHNIFTNCTFDLPITTTASSTAGFSFDGGSLTTQKSGESDSNIVDSCTFIGGYYGANWRSNTTSGSNGNKVMNSTFMDQDQYPLYILNMDEFTASGNDISRATRTSGLGTYYAMYFTGPSDNSIIEKNYIHDPAGSNPSQSFTGYFIYMLADASSAATANIVQNNVVVDNQGLGTHYGIYANGATNCKIYHNTILHNHTGATSGNTRGIYSTGQPSDIRNNIVSISRGGSGAKYGIYLNTAPTACDNNNVYMTSTGGTINSWGYNGGNRVDLAAWKAANASIGQNATEGDPDFPAAPNLVPGTLSTIPDNGGANVGVTEDYTGATRGAIPDMGAFEFTVACPSPNNLTDSNVTATSVDVTWVEPGSATVWDLEVKPFGVAPTGTPDSVGVTNNVNFTIGGLALYQAYDVYIRSVCGGTNGNSIWAGPITIQACQSLAGTYTIDPAIVTGGTNFQTFTDAAIALGCGISAPVVFDVAPGSTFNEQVSFSEVMGASATNTITFNGNNSTITSATSAVNYNVVQLDGSDYFTFNDLTFDATSTTTAFAIQLLNASNGTNNNTFKRCTFQVNPAATSSNTAAFVMTSNPTSASTAWTAEADSNLIDSCVVSGGYYGITMNGQTSGTCDHNAVTNTTITDAYVYGFYTAYQDDLLFANNDISRPTRTTVSTFYGVYATAAGDRNVFENNRIHDPAPMSPGSSFTNYAFYFLMDAPDMANANIIRNNVFDNMQGIGTQYLAYLNGAQNHKFIHNTVVSDYAAAASGNTRLYYSTGTGAGEVQNNIFVLGRGGSGAKYGIYKNSTTAGTVIDHNNVYISSGATAAGTNYYGYNAGNQADLTAWQASTPSVGTGSSDIDPIFAQPAPNYSPANALLDNTGTPLSVMTDYLGTARSATTPDMGAFEFSIAPTDIGVTAILSPDTTVGCYSAADTVEVELTNFGSTAHDFSTNPTTVTVQVTGAVTTTLTATLNTGTLAVLGTQSFKIVTASVNMSASGTYTMNAYSSTTGDAALANDTLATPYVYNANLVAGTATSSLPDICVSNTPTISLTGNYGGSIQWEQSTVSGMGPWSPVGTDSTGYTPTSAQTVLTYYRAVLTCNTNVDSTNVDTVEVFNPTITSTMNDTVCGPNSATLMATASSGVVNWFADATGGASLDTGNTFATPVISATDTFYASAIEGNAASGACGTTPSPLLIGEMDLGSPDYIELVNVSGGAIDFTGWKVATSDDYSIFDDPNPTVNTITGVIPAGGNYGWSDATGGSGSYSYWGNNLYYSPGATNGHWTLLLDPCNNVRDAVFINWSATDIANGSITVPGVGLVATGSLWSGAGALGSQNNIIRVGTKDNDDASDWINNGTPSIGSNDAGLMLPFAFGCEGPRLPVYAVVNPSSGDLALTTSTNATSTAGTDSLNDMHGDGATLSYYNPSCELIATVEDTVGNNVLGMVTSKVNVEATVQTHGGQPYARRWYDISVQNQGPATVSLYYTQADFDDYNAYLIANSNPHQPLPTGPTDAAGIARVRVSKYNGGLGATTAVAITPTSTTWDAGNNRWEVIFPVASFSQFYLHTGGNVAAVLPVTLTKFTVSKEGSVSLAAWITASERNNSHFNVQRSLDGNDFTTLGTVNTKAANGNSSSELNYDFTDYVPQIGHNYYRLEQVDQDGQKSYSKIVDVVWGADGSVVSIYPNPATDKLNVDVSIDKVAQMEVRLLDMSGRVVKSVLQQTEKGMNNVTLDLSNIATGVYGVQIYENNALIHTAKVNKQVK